METEHPNPEMWWRHRRRHSYLAMLMLSVVALGVFLVDISEAQATVITAIVYGDVAIIGAYVAACTWDDIATKRLK